MPISPDACPNKANHNTGGVGMRPTRCHECRRFLIFVPANEPSPPPPTEVSTEMPLFYPTVDYPFDPYTLPVRYPDPGPPVVAIDPDVMTAEQMMQAVNGEVIYVPVEPDQMT